MSRRIDLTRPAPFRAPGIPQAGRLRRTFTEKGLTLRPLKGPSIPLPADQDTALEDRANAWLATHGGSLLEFIAWDWLVGKKHQIENVDFVMQYPVMGGRTAFGGFISDFYFPGLKMVWNINGLRWHWVNTDDRARMGIAKLLLASRGILSVDLWEDSLLTRADFVLEKAWHGEGVDNWRT